MGTHPTKENRKGRTRRYNYECRAFVVFVACLVSSIIAWQISNHISRRSNIGFNNGKTGKMTGLPIRRIEYGVQSTPVVMIQSSLEDGLLKRFLQEPLYSCSEVELNTYPGLENRVDDPVHVYEGYYHSLPTKQTVYSKNPNPLIGKDFEKPPASSFTKAFFEAVREVNRHIFDTLQQELTNSSSLGDTGKPDVCYLLAQWIDQGRHFGDLSIQIHYGRGNQQKLKSGQAWHTDAENSLLHLAVSLRGKRVLHSKRDLHKNNNLRQEQVEVLETQHPGGVYLSSSALFRHAPEFFETDYSHRVIAIHARFLYTSADIAYFREVRTEDTWAVLTNVLANTLARADFKVPTIAQVESYLTAQSRVT